jgi:predicted RNase H-like HicB family nuclease
MLVSYVALIEDGSDDTAFGVVFPDLPGCFSAGDTLDEALKNASEALSLYCEVAIEDGQRLPEPRTLDAISEDEVLKADFADTTYRFVSISANVPASGTSYSQGGSDYAPRPGFEESSE